MNINGYALIPRFVIVMIGYIVIFFKPTVFASSNPSSPLFTMIILDLIEMAYSIYGYVVTPSESKMAADKASE